MLFTIAPAAVEAIVAHARDAAPLECCGLLVGEGSAIRVAVRARNLAPDPNRFLVDPKDHIDARREARRRHLAVLGFYHSHPRSAPIPSPTDLDEADYPDHLHAIVSLASDPPALRAFEIRDRSASPVRLVFDGPSPGQTPAAILG
jgi:proteasome lid subunit RPN8/RPN11